MAQDDGTNPTQESQGKYILVNALSLRIRALHSGYKPLVTRPGGDLPAVAIEELKQGKIRIQPVAEGQTVATPEQAEQPAEKSRPAK